jgi:hypothetical protein
MQISVSGCKPPQDYENFEGLLGARGQQLEAKETGAVRYAPRDYYVTVRRLQRAELLDDEEPQNDTGSDREEEVLCPVPQAYAA